MHSMREDIDDGPQAGAAENTIQKTKKSLTRIESRKSMLITNIAPTGRFKPNSCPYNFGLLDNLPEIQILFCL